MSQNQVPTQRNKQIADMKQLVYTWHVLPVSAALVEVGVPQIIPADGSGLDVAQIAQKANVDERLLFRYLHFVSSLGVFTELPNRHFVHNESSKLLLPGNSTFYLLLFWSNKGGMMTAAEYSTQLRDPSKIAFEHAFKMPYWEYIGQTRGLEKLFADFMQVQSNEVMPDLLRTIELPDTGIVADVGGGYGHVLLEFLKAKPELTGMVFELPIVAKQVELGLQDPNPQNDSIYSKYTFDVKKRMSVVVGNYNDNSQLKQIANADVFFFKWIFHDNSDAVCSKILAGLYQIMKPTAKIIICEFVLKNKLNEWEKALTLDLLMGVTFDAKERTKNEWIKLLSNGEGYQYTVSFGDCTICPQIWEMELITLTKNADH